MVMVVAVVVAVIMAVAVAVVVPVAVTMRVSVIVVVIMIVAFSAKMVVSIALMEDLHHDQVENECKYCDTEHLLTDHLRWREEPLSGLNEEPHCHDPDSRDRDHRSNDLSTVPAVCQMVVRASGTKL